MSDLEKSIQQAQRDLQRTGPVAVKKNRQWRIPVLPIVLIITALLAWNQMSLLRVWIFGVPDEQVAADLQNLLERADEKLVRVHDLEGSYPTALPSDTPTWLLGYKTTLSGYKLSAKVDDVRIELERSGAHTQIRRTD